VIIYYDNKFNGNEWFVISVLIIGLAVICILPRRFPRKLSAVYFLYGVFTGFFFDHTISVEPIDFYDVNDNSSYQVMDFLTYLMYGPFSYIFVYLYDSWKIKSAHVPIYILTWVLLAMGMEWIGLKIGVYHYKNGYELYYSFPIYLLVQSAFIILIYALRKKQER
jgi:hypothetical protein